MKSLNVTVRGIEDAVYRRFKAKAVEEGLKLSDASTQAMKLWIEQRSRKERTRLLDIKPFNGGRAQRKLVLR